MIRRAGPPPLPPSIAVLFVAAVKTVWIIMIVAIVVCAIGMGYLIFRLKKTGAYEASTADMTSQQGSDILKHF